MPKNGRRVRVQWQTPREPVFEDLYEYSFSHANHSTDWLAIAAKRYSSKAERYLVRVDHHVCGLMNGPGITIPPAENPHVECIYQADQCNCKRSRVCGVV